MRGGVFNPPGDGLNGIGNGRIRILFDQVPAIDHVVPGYTVQRGLVVKLLAEIAESGVIAARLVAIIRHGDERVLKLNGHGAGIGHGELPPAVDGRWVVIDVLHHYRGIFRIASDVQEFGFSRG